MRVTSHIDFVSYIGISGYFDARVLTLEGTNTSGHPEVYKLVLEGTYSDGSCRLSLSVQRTNGKFAHMHQSNAPHIYRRAASAAKNEISEYENTFTGYRENEES